MQSTLQEPIWGMLTQARREAGLNLEFGMMNLEIQHDAFTRHDMGSRKGAKALSNPPGAEPR